MNSSSREGRSAASALDSSGRASGVVTWSRAILSYSSKRASHRTGVRPTEMICQVRQWLHRSRVSVVVAGTSLRLVVPHRVQFHSAVAAGTLVITISVPSPHGGELLQGA